jgi:hypothetical protein
VIQGADRTRHRFRHVIPAPGAAIKPVKISGAGAADRVRRRQEAGQRVFATAAADATLPTVFPGVDTALMRADLKGGRSHAIEITVRPKRRMLMIALSISRAMSNGQALLVVECQNITRIRELESMIDSYSALVERNTREIEREKERVERERERTPRFS